MSVYGTPAVKIILNTTDPSGSFILNQYAGPQTGNFWVTGKGRVDTRLGIGGLDPAYALHVATVDPISASFSGRVIGADAVNPNEFITKAQMEAAIAVGATLTATQVGFGSPTNTLTGSGKMTFNSTLGKLTLITATGRLIQLGDAAPVAGPNPVQIHMGGSYSDTAGANLKLVLYDNNIGNQTGFGVTTSGLDHVTGGGSHKFFVGTTQVFGMSATQISVLNSLQIVWEDVLGPKMAFYGGAGGGNAGYNMGVATGGILYANVPTGGKHALRINGVDAFTISGAGATITTVANDDTKTALMVWDSTDKLVRWRSVASVTTGFLTAITANNGLTATTVSNVQLGSPSAGTASPLLHNTYINTEGFWLNVRGGILDILNGTLIATNTGGGTAFLVSAYGADNAHANAHAMRIDNLFTSGNTVEPILQILRSTAATAGTSGVGGSIDFRAAYGITGGNNPATTTNRLISKWTTAGSESQFIITGVAGSMADLFTLNGTGITRLNKYGGGLITGTATFNLAVDTTGKIIEVSTTPTTAPVHNLLSTIHTDTVTGAPVLGALIVGNGTPAWDRLLGHTVAAKRFLTQTGTGVNSAIPIWGSIAAGDLPDLSGTYVPTTRTLTINGNAQTLTADRTWTITTTGTVNRITVTGGSGMTPTIDIAATYVGQASITTVGTITTGVWNGSTVMPIYGGTGLTSYVLGDILYASAANVLAALPGNTSTIKRFLIQTGTGTISAAPAWGTIGAADLPDLSTTYVPTSRILTINGSAQDLTVNRTWTITTTGTTNRITVTGGAGLTPTIDIAATYAGQASIVTVGTITTGTWNGTAIGPTFGGTGITSYALGDTLYASATNVLSKLPGNITTGKLFLSQTGTGVVSAAPLWSAMAGSDITGAALTKTDDTNVTLTLGGTPATALLRATSITVGWAGTLSVTRGGTGLATVAQGDLLYGSAANTYSLLNKSVAANMFLKNSGPTNNPAWSAITAADIGIGAALTKVDDTNVTLTLTGTPSSALLIAAGITVGWAGSLAPGRGGTGITTYVLGDTLYASAANVLSKLSGNITAVKQFLSQTGTGAVSAAPVWATIVPANLSMATARILGRLTAGTGSVEELTGTQVTTMLDLFSTTATTKGLVPGSNGAATTNFLRADGVWAVPPAGGGGGYTTLSQFVDETAWRMYYSNAAGDITPFALGTANQVLQSTGVSAAPTWVTIGSGTIGGSLAATQVAYGSAANTITGSANFIFTNGTGTLTLNTAGGKLLQLGEFTASASASPVSINMGSSHSSTAGTNAKLALYDGGSGVTTQAGFGISASQLDYIVPAAFGHRFYVGGVQVVDISTVQIGIYGSGQVGWENVVGQKMNFFGGPGAGASGYNMGVASGDLYHNVPTSAKHGFRVNGVELFAVNGAAGITTTYTTVVDPAAIGSFIYLHPAQTGDAIQVRQGATNIFRVLADGSLIINTGNAVAATFNSSNGTGSHVIANSPSPAFSLQVGGAYKWSMIANDVIPAGAPDGITDYILYNQTSGKVAFYVAGATNNIAIGNNGATYWPGLTHSVRKLNVFNYDATVNTSTPDLRLIRSSATGGGTGTGTGIEVEMAITGGPGGAIAAYLETYWVDGGGAPTSAFRVNLTNAALTPTPAFQALGTGEIWVNTLVQDDALTKVAVWDNTSKLIKWRNVTTIGGGGGTIGGSLAATQVAYGSAANTITGSANFIFVAGQLTLNKATGLNLMLGDLTQTSTASPTQLNLGGSYASAAGSVGSNLKLSIADHGGPGGQYGITVTAAAALEFHIPAAASAFDFYAGGVRAVAIQPSRLHIYSPRVISFDGGAGPRIDWWIGGGNGISMTGGSIQYTADPTVYHDFRVSTASIFQVQAAGATSPGTGVESERLGLTSNAAGNYSLAIGRAATVSAGASYGIAIGYSVTAGNQQAIVIGYASATTAQGAVMIGVGNQSHNFGVAIGNAAVATGVQSVAVGFQANATNQYNTAVGNGASASNNSSAAFGSGANGAGYLSNAFGSSAQALGNWTFAVGYLAYASHEACIAIGRESGTTANYQAVIGGAGGMINYFVVGNNPFSSAPFGSSVSPYGTFPIYLTVTGGSGTDIPGSTLAVAAGRGTGAAATANILLQTSDPIASGTTLQTLSTKLTVGQYGIQPYMGYWSVAPAGAAGYMQYNSYNNNMYVHDGTTWRNMITGGNGPSGLQSTFLASNGLKMYYDGTYYYRWNVLLGDAYSWTGEPNLGTSMLGSSRYIPLNGQTLSFVGGTNEAYGFANFVGHGMTIGHNTYIPDIPILRVGAFNGTAKSTGWWNPVGATGPGTVAHFYSVPVTYGNGAYPYFSVVTIENDAGPDYQGGNYSNSHAHTALTVLLRLNTVDGAQTSREWIALRVASDNVVGNGVGGLHGSRMYSIKATKGRIHSEDGFHFGSKTADDAELAYAGYMTFRSDTGKYRVHNGTGWRNLAYEGALVNPWRVFYSDGGGVMTELAIGAAGLVLTSNGAAAAPSWIAPPGAGGGGTPGLPDTSVQYNAAGSFAGSAQMTFASGTLHLTKASGINLQLGTNVSVAAGPVQINMGGSYNSGIPKLIIHDDGTYRFGIGLSLVDTQAGLNYITPYANSNHTFSIGGGDRFMVHQYGASVLGSGTLYFGSTSNTKIMMYTTGGGNYYDSFLLSADLASGKAGYTVPGDAAWYHSFSKGYTSFFNLGAYATPTILSSMYLYSLTADTTAFRIDLQSGQTGDAIRILNSGLTTIASINAVGGAYFENLKLNTVAQDDTKTNILTWDATDKIVRWRAASTLGGAGSTAISALTAAAAANTIDNGNFKQTWKWNNIGADFINNVGLELSSTAGSTIGANAVVQILRTGGSGAAPLIGLAIGVSTTGTQNVGLSVSVSGASTNNAIQVGAGNIAFDTGGGSLSFKGATSGTVNITRKAIAGTWTMTLPDSAGTSGYVLSTDGAGVTSWVPPATGGGGGTVTSFAFTNANGFSGSVATPTATPTLTLSTTLTTGSVPFIGAAGALLEDNALLFWDNTNKRLGVGTNAPTYRMQINGSAYVLNSFAHVPQGGWAAFFSNTVQVPASSSFTSGYTWAGGASSNTMQFAGSSSINQGAIIAGHTVSNRTEFTGAGATITMTQATGIRALVGLQILSQTVGTIAGTVTHGASLMIQGVYPNGSGIINFNNYYGIVINPLDEWGVVTFTNRWAIYQQGANDPSYFASRIQINNVSSQGAYMLQVTGGVYFNVTSATMRIVGLTTDNAATQVLAKNTAGDHVWRDVSSISGGGGTIGGSIAATQVAYGSAANAIAGSADMTFASGLLTLNKATGKNLQLGDLTSAATATPVQLNLGGSFSSTSGANAKLALYDNGAGGVYGFGVSANGIDHIVPVNVLHRFYSGATLAVTFGTSGITIHSVPLAIGDIGMRLQMRAGQTADAFQVTDSALTVLASISATGLTYVASLKMEAAIQDDSMARILAWDNSSKLVRWRNASTIKNPRVGTVASSTSLTIDSDSYDMYTVTALAATMVMNNPSGTPVEGQKLMIRIEDNGTLRTITWSGTQWRAGDIALPITTVATKIMYLGFTWHATDSKWDLIAYSDNY